MDQPWVYIVLFGLVFIVYAKIMPKSNTSKGQQNPTINEIEETMEHFTAELDEQNKALIQLLAETKRDYELQSARLTSRIEMLEKQSGQVGQDIMKLGVVTEDLQKQISQPREMPLAVPLEPNSASVEVAAAIIEDVPETASTPMNIKVRYSELFDMYDQGKAIDHIAKKLGMNKGEVNLIIQLAKQEERLNAH
ncbi:hypothetical protein GC093_09260 [Paenibacillus sp. LMG 31456]|uniref:DUF2802 domain-containing protein n=1 Tax=Paenibacillus foliorum TaxID=2654974 RepID=A0A972GS10_9BACL|nr:hypothetical protein [Paenibacillus foliorum]NOU93404.1 hypothetical protein [Paenibacillus foliorum]